MKFQADREVMHEAVSFAVRLISPKVKTPQLSGVLITVSSSSVELSVYDHEVSAKASFPGAVDSTGQALVQGKLLSDIVSKLPGQTVSVEVVDNRVQISSGASKFTLTPMVLGDYPPTPEFPDSIGSVNATDFAHSVTQVSPAASKEEATAVLTTVALSVQGNNLSLLATDKFRVAHKSLAWSGNTGEREVLLPARVIQEIAKTFTNSGQLEIGLSGEGKELVGFRSAEKSVTSATVKAKFPPVLSLFPDMSAVDHFAVVATQDLIEATRRIALVVEKDKPIRYRFSGSELFLETIGGDLAEASEAIQAVLTGEDVAVSLKPQFVIDVLLGVDTENAQIVFTQNRNNPGKPGPVQIAPHATKGQAPAFRYLLQPNLMHV